MCSSAVRRTQQELYPAQKMNHAHILLLADERWIDKNEKWRCLRGRNPTSRAARVVSAAPHELCAS